MKRIVLHAAHVGYIPNTKSFSANNIDNLNSLHRMSQMENLVFTDCEHITWYTLYLCMQKAQKIHLYGNVYVAFNNTNTNVFNEQVCFWQLFCISQKCKDIFADESFDAICTAPLSQPVHQGLTAGLSTTTEELSIFSRLQSGDLLTDWVAPIVGTPQWTKDIEKKKSKSAPKIKSPSI